MSSQGSRPGKPRKRRHKASKDKQPAQAHDGNSAQHLCAMLLHVLTTTQDNHDALLGGGAVLLLVKLSQSPNEVTKTAVAGSLYNPVWKSTSELGRRGQTTEISSSVKSKSIRLIFGRIDCSRRVLEAQRKSLVQTVRLRAH